MSALTAVHRILQDDTGVSALAANRRWDVELAQNAGLPALVLTPVSLTDDLHLGGSNRYPEFVFNVDAIGLKFGDADALGDAVMEALTDYRGVVAGYDITSIFHNDIDYVDKGETGEHFRRRLSFVMRYRLADDPDDSPPGP